MSLDVIYKGVDWRERITIVDADGTTRTDLTGKVLLFHLRRRTGATVLVELGVGTGITLLTQSGDTVGQADIVLPGGSTASLESVGHVVSALLDGAVVLAPTRVAVATI